MLKRVARILPAIPRVQALYARSGSGFYQAVTAKGPKITLLRKYSDVSDSKAASIKVDEPQMMIAFTCKKCNTRSSHVFSKQSYQKGTVLIQCPGCKGRHLIADNLKIFRDKSVNIEDLLQAQGDSVAKTATDLAFDDIPESLRDKIGHHAKDAPDKYRRQGSSESGNEALKLSDSKDSK